MMIASRSANVVASPTAGVQLTEGPLAAEVPVGIFFPQPGVLRCNAGPAARDTDATFAGDTNGAAYAFCELLAVKLGIRGGPCWPPAIHVVIP